MPPHPHYNKDHITVAGVYYRPIHNDPKKLSLLKKGSCISLEREPTNPYDRNAIKVKPHCLEVDDWIGYIPKEIAKDLAPILDRGSQYQCILDSIYTYRGGPRFVLQLSTFPVPACSPKAQQSPPSKPAFAPSFEDPNSPTGKRFRKHTDIDAHIEKYIGVSGVYVIWSRDYKCYVGQSGNIGVRWKKHRYELFKGAHLNNRLQKAWINNGANLFRFDLLEQADPMHLDQLEKRYIQKLDSFFSGYNGTEDGQAGEPPLINQYKTISIDPAPTQPLPEISNRPLYISATEPLATNQSEKETKITGGKSAPEKELTKNVGMLDPDCLQKMKSSHKMLSPGHQAEDKKKAAQWTFFSLIALILTIWLIDATRPPVTKTPQQPQEIKPQKNKPQEVKPQEVSGIQSNVFPSWYKDHARSLWDAGRWDELIDVAKKWTEIEPEDERSWYLLGEGYLGLEKFSEALAAFRQILRISPNHREAWKKIAVTYIRAGQPKVARDIALWMKATDPQLAKEIEKLTK